MLILMFIDCILFHKDFSRGMKKKGYGTLTGNMSRSGFTSETTNVSEGCHCHVASLHRFPLASVAAGKHPSFFISMDSRPLLWAILFLLNGIPKLLLCGFIFEVHESVVM